MQSDSRRPRAYGVAVRGAELRREMRMRGLTGAELARSAGVSSATVPQAVNDRRVHPRKLHAIVGALAALAPLPGLAQFADPDREVSDRQLHALYGALAELDPEQVGYRVELAMTCHNLGLTLWEMARSIRRGSSLPTVSRCSGIPGGSHEAAYFSPTVRRSSCRARNARMRLGSCSRTRPGTPSLSRLKSMTR